MARKHADTRHQGPSDLLGPSRVIRLAGGGSLRDGADGGVNAEVRLHRVTLGVEDVEGVIGAHGEAESVEVDGAGAVAVDAADVDHEFLVNEDPDVVVAGECEGLTAGVSEDGVNFSREVEVVYA